MKQLTINGFEGFEKEPIELIESLNNKGYSWLSDWNSGSLLTKSDSCDPYIPYRIKFPSGFILDEEEIFQDFSDLEKLGFSRMEIQLARNFYNAINDEKVDKDLYKFTTESFISREDEVLTKEKYSKQPFYLRK